MRAVRVAWALAFSTVFLSLGVRGAESRALNGSEYLRLDEWGRARGLTLTWRTPLREFRLTGKTTTLGFAVDSRKVSLNGVSVWLSFPIALNHGLVWIATKDLHSALNPVLFPARSKSGRGLKTICLDPGHGGRDAGRHEGARQEKHYTLLLAQELRAALVKAGFSVMLTRTTDTEVDLEDRPAIARRRGADLFLSLHFNAFEGPGASTVKGVETYCLTPPYASSTNTRGQGASTGACLGNRFDASNMLLAYHLQRALVRQAGLEDRGVKRARFAVLRDAPMPAALIEAGFMSHRDEARRIYDAAHRRTLASAIVEGVLAYKRQTEPKG
jgi:N-acetylmuramoyl-L-alanine amidase